MKLSAAFEASIALSFGDVSDAYQFFPSTLGISDNPDYRANLQHCRITDIDYKRNHAGVSDHVRQTVRWWRRPSRALSTPHRPKAGKPMTQPTVDRLNCHRFILADIVPPNRQERDVVRNPGMVSFVIDIGDPAVLQIGSIIWIVRDSQSTREELVGIRHIAERQCDGSFKRRR